MSNLKTRIAATAGVLALAGGLAASAPVSSWAATPSCGASCINLFSREYSGQSLGNPQFVVDVLRQGEKVNQPVILFRSANSDPAEDWTLNDQGTVADFYAAGLVSSAVALHYGCDGTVPVAGAQIPCSANSQDDTAYEIQYAPFGVDSGLCMGVASQAAAGVKVSLQPCGVSGKTVWIQDTVDSPVTPYYAAINGSDTNFSDPFVLTYSSSAYPTDKPRSQLYVTNLTGFSSGPTDNDNQLWTGVAGVLP